MLTPEQLAGLAADMESFRVERKASAASLDKIEEAICAFSNDLPGTGTPGVILVGVDDKTGKPTNLPITDELLLKLTNIRSSGKILPFLADFMGGQHPTRSASREATIIEIPLWPPRSTNSGSCSGSAWVSRLPARPVPRTATPNRSSFLARRVSL